MPRLPFVDRVGGSGRNGDFSHRNPYGVGLLLDKRAANAMHAETVVLGIASQLLRTSAMKAVVPVYRYGVAPDLHRVPSWRSSHLEHRR